VKPEGLTPHGLLRRWRAACALLGLILLTLIIGLVVPSQRQTSRLKAQHLLLEAEHAKLREQLGRDQERLSGARAENARLEGELNAQKSASVDVQHRIDKLKELVLAQFGRLSQAKMLTVSSAGDRVSIAVAGTVLFPNDGPEVSANGRSLLCQLSNTIMTVFDGQIRVTGYYGKPRIEERDLARRYASPWELSAARAAGAVRVLETGCGAPTDRFLVVGYGPRAAGPLGENVALEFVFKAAE
jgi:chemotaxis protein MotB